MSVRRFPLGLGLVAAVAVLVSCSGAEPARDVAYYRAHAAERTAKLAACRNDVGHVAPTANCINALAADSEAQSRRFWSVHKPASRVADPGKL